jgi:hypothetical protein
MENVCFVILQTNRKGGNVKIIIVLGIFALLLFGCTQRSPDTKLSAIGKNNSLDLRVQLIQGDYHINGYHVVCDVDTTTVGCMLFACLPENSNMSCEYIIGDGPDDTLRTLNVQKVVVG